MSTPDVAVIDYGTGNLLSVQRALEYCGARVDVTADHETILHAPHVVLPGVGAFANGMAELRSRELDTVVREVAAKGVPLLAICLGMQMLLDRSEEFGVHEGLGIIAGCVVPVPATDADERLQKIPHIGWNNLILPEGRASWAQTPLADLQPGDAVYFVHSFMAQPDDSRHRLADCQYGGMPVSAAIAKDNVFGCQFHPEKSGETGLKILRRFLSP
jgi:imidazole glycerol-phosphate synthase subunit HisH